MDNTAQEFDYIILGAGCSGLSLVVRMIQSGSFTNKKILIIDKAPKQAKDKTWCFWDDGSIESFWKNARLINHEWKQLWLKHSEGNLKIDIEPYSYKMIRSADFNRYCFSIVNNAAHWLVYFS